jgi:hypothetical protein
MISNAFMFALLIAVLEVVGLWSARRLRPARKDFDFEPKVKS